MKISLHNACINPRGITITALFLLVLLSGCISPAKQETKTLPQKNTLNTQTTVNTVADTVTYLISFENEEKQAQFNEEFQKFIKKYHSETTSKNFVSNIFKLRIFKDSSLARMVKEISTTPKGLDFSSIDNIIENKATDSSIIQDTNNVTVDTTTSNNDEISIVDTQSTIIEELPNESEELTIYSDRMGFYPPFLDLIADLPFSAFSHKLDMNLDYLFAKETPKENHLIDTLVAIDSTQLIDSTGETNFSSMDPFNSIEEKPFDPFEGAKNYIRLKQQERDKNIRNRVFVEMVNPTTMRITLGKDLINLKGQRISSFEVLQKWTKFITEMPAEGYALFKNVYGIKRLIRGEEAIIPGITIESQYSLTLKLTKKDPDALTRLYSPYLLPRSFRAGPYAVSIADKSRAILHKNSHSNIPTYFNKLTVISGGTVNPLIGFAQNKYDFLPLYEKDQINYAKTKLAHKGKLIPLTKERYFISINESRKESREMIRSVISPKDLLQNTLRAEGELITGITKKHEELSTTPIHNNTDFSTLNNLKIIYNNEDPISEKIARKLYSLFLNNGVRCQLQKISRAAYEKALVLKDYSIAIGWVSENIEFSKVEQLRLETIWFDGFPDEDQRIAEYYEVPLFKLHRYALCNYDVKIYKNRFTNLYKYTPPVSTTVDSVVSDTTMSNMKMDTTQATMDTTQSSGQSSVDSAEIKEYMRIEGSLPEKNE